MIIEVIDSDSEDFPPGSEYQFKDFVVWLQHSALPDRFVFRCFDKYWRANGTFVTNGIDTYSVTQFVLYRPRIGLIEEQETKIRVLHYISTQSDLRYHKVSAALGVSNACIGYHIADLRKRGLIEVDPLVPTEIGEIVLAVIASEGYDCGNGNRISVCSGCDGHCDSEPPTLRPPSCDAA